MSEHYEDVRRALVARGYLQGRIERFVLGSAVAVLGSVVLGSVVLGRAGAEVAACAASPPPKALATDRSADVTSLGMTQNVLPWPCASCGSVCRYC